MSQEIFLNSQTPVVSLDHLNPLEDPEQLTSVELLLRGAILIKQGIKRGYSQDYIAEQLKGLIQKNSKASTELQWREDTLWIKQELLDPFFNKGKDSSPTTLTGHQLMIPGLNGREMAISITDNGPQILDARGNMTPQEKKYANARLSSDPKINVIPGTLEEVFQKGGGHQYSPPADPQVQKLANQTLLIMGVASLTAGGVAIGGLSGLSTAFTSTQNLVLRAGTWLTLHPNANKWFDQAVKFGKGYIEPPSETPQSSAELAGMGAYILQKYGFNLFSSINAYPPTPQKNNQVY